MNGTIPNNDRPLTLDPTMIRRASDNKLFLYTTAKNGSVWTADSLYGPWTHVGIAELPERGGAPSIHMINDTYYMYYNNHEFDYRTIGVENKEAQTRPHGACLLAASSKTLEPGSWEQHGRLEIDWAMKYNILDGALITVEDDNDTRHLLSFGSYQQGIFQLPLANPPTQLADGAMDRLTHLANNQSIAPVNGPTEASYIFKWQDYYYLFFSSGHCCINREKAWSDVGDVYKVMVCRSKDPRTGYIDDQGRDCVNQSGGTEILASHDGIWAPGGQGVMTDEEAGGPIMYYHYVPYDEDTNTPAMAYQFGWNKLDFSSGWPVVV
ncbi:glycosyl hydrolase [Biscogniauxia sp. FL1348]|nr:glycosyl hydrolase [Biscogniauxia sp. FL1348]